MDQLQPRWVLFGGVALAFMVSAVNIDFMLNLGVSVSHLTGDVSRLTADATRDFASASSQLRLLGSAVGGFVAGALLAGVFIHQRRFDLRRPYGRSVVGIGGLFLVSASLRDFSLELSCCLAAMGCGMQNGLTTHYRGMVLRTTHITGILTDIGVLLGLRIQGVSVEPWRLLSHVALVLAFAAGAVAGAGIDVYTDFSALTVFGVAYVIGGIGWVIAKRTVLKPRISGS